MVIALYIAFITYSVPLCLVCATVPRTYTNEWAVKLSGGRDSADEIASKHGFENRGLVRPLSACVSVFLCDLARLSIAAPQVAGLSDVYLFALRNHPDRSTSPFADKSTLAIAENGVRVLVNANSTYNKLLKPISLNNACDFYMYIPVSCKEILEHTLS